MLSLGGDAAVSRECLVSIQKKTDVLLIGNLKHFSFLISKLRSQPFDFRELSENIEKIIKRKKASFIWRASRFTISLNKPILMGIINLTYDSFSGDGILRISRTQREVVNNTLRRVEEMLKEGARIIDIGAQSSRPFSKSIPKKEELNRLLPVLKGVVQEFRDIPISVDTFRAEVARVALEEGAAIINDIKGTRDPAMREVLKNSDCGIVLMHMQGIPQTMQKNPKYDDVVLDIVDFFKRRLSVLERIGIDISRIVLDPGIGFGKTVDDNYKILKYIDEFSILGRPLLLGISRKSFVGAILKKGPQERLYGTLGATAWVISQGVHILRTHDPAETLDVIKIIERINNV